MFNDQGVIFIVKGRGDGQRPFKIPPHLFVSLPARELPHSGENAPGVIIHDKDGLFSRIKQDGVGCFGADARGLKQRKARFGQNFLS